MKMIGKNIAIGLILLSVIGGQFFLIPPPKAQAVFGVGDISFDTQIGNVYDILKDIGLAAAQRIALNYANKYLTRFVDKVIDKYRIKDYLAYDKVLSGYYLNKYIYDNVQDPDLRAIYGLLARDVNSRATATSSTGQTQPLLAALRQKIDKYYYDHGGIDSNRILNPYYGAFASDQEYFAAAQAYFANPPDFTQQELYGQFGRMVADSQKAAGTEVSQSEGGYKNDRSTPTGVIPHVCVGGNRYPQQYDNGDGSSQYFPKDPINLEADCNTAGGEWKVDASGIAQSAIQNPSALIHNFTTNAIQSVFKGNYEVKDNNYSKIGAFLGNYIFKQLNVDKSGGTFNESGAAYKADSGIAPMVKDVDVDSDNIPDGQDVDGDDKITNLVDVCYHGGTPPNCRNSGSVQTSPYFTPICSAIDRAVTALAVYSQFMNDHAELMQDGAKYKGLYQQIMAEPIDDFSRLVLGTDSSSGTVDNFVNKADSEIWGRRSQLAQSAIDDITNNIQSYNSSYFDTPEITINRYSNFISRITQSLLKDQDLDLARKGSGGGGLGNLIANTAYTLRYLKYLKGQIGKCDNPNLQAVAAAPAPTIYDPGNGGAPSDCIVPPTPAQQQEAQDAINFMIPLLEAIPKMNPIVTPAPADYQAQVQDIINQANAQFPAQAALYYPGENVIGMSINYIVGPATIVVSNQVGIGDTWRNAWRVTCP